MSLFLFGKSGHLLIILAVYRLIWPSTYYFKGIISFKGFTALYLCWVPSPCALLFSSPITCGPRKKKQKIPKKKIRKTQNSPKKNLVKQLPEREGRPLYIFSILRALTGWTATLYFIFCIGQLFSWRPFASLWPYCAENSCLIIVHYPQTIFFY